MKPVEVKKGNRQHLMAAVVSIGIVAPLAWMIFDREPPFRIESGMITPAHAAPGDEVRVDWTISTKHSCYPAYRVSVTRTFTDKNGEVHVFNPIVHTEFLPQRELTIPLMPPGPARYVSKACYACNPIQEIWPVCVETPPITIVIDGADDGNRAVLRGPPGPPGPQGPPGPAISEHQ